MDDAMYIKFIMWGAGLVFTLVNTWALFLIKGLKDSIKAINDKMEQNEKEHVAEHARLYEKLNETTNRMDREFVHKDNLADFKQEMRDSFKEVKDLIQDQIKGG